jgi:hypothetical protein
MRSAALAVLFACACMMQSSEAVPIRGSDVVSLGEPGSSEPVVVSQQSADIAAVNQAEKEVEAVTLPVLAKAPPAPVAQESQAPLSVVGPDVPAAGVNKMVADITEPTRTDAKVLHALPVQVSDAPDANGNLKPGQKGYLAQQIEGRVVPFKETMAAINHRLHRKWTEERNSAYAHDEAARLAADASQAVGNMAHEVGTEAEENAEHKAALAAQCAQDMMSITDKDAKSLKAKECEQLLDAKRRAYDEAADAMSASTKAIDAAGAREGEIAGMAGVHADGTSRLVVAENNAIGAKLLLKNFEKEEKTDDAIAERRLKAKLENERLIAHANSLEQQAQDNFDADQAADDAKPPPAPLVVARLPQEKPDATSQITIPKQN